MFKTLWTAPVVSLSLLSALSGPLAADEENTSLQAQLNGFEQVPPVNTTGTGSFEGHINADGTITYKLTYSKLSATGAVNFADIHFGQEHFTPNGIILLLCSNQSPTNPGGIIPPAGTPPCPNTSGKVTRTIGADSIVGPAAQGINPGDLSAAVRALLNNTTYAQVHTVAFTNGEIRGQIEREDDSDQDADRRR
jgi:hypothetical protein